MCRDRNETRKKFGHSRDQRETAEEKGGKQSINNRGFKRQILPTHKATSVTNSHKSTFPLASPPAFSEIPSSSASTSTQRKVRKKFPPPVSHCQPHSNPASKPHETPRNPTKPHETPRNPTKPHETPKTPLCALQPAVQKPAPP